MYTFWCMIAILQIAPLHVISAFSIPEESEIEVKKRYFIGPQGYRGHRGHRGHIGTAGPTGPEGPNGNIGPSGTVQGPTGPIGKNGKNGQNGQNGQNGLPGEEGGVATAYNYAIEYSQNPSDAIIIAPLTPGPFLLPFEIPVQNSPNMSTLGTTTFLCIDPGIYLVKLMHSVLVSPAIPGSSCRGSLQLDFLVNGVVVANASTFQPFQTTVDTVVPVNAQAILEVPASGTIEIQASSNFFQGMLTYVTMEFSSEISGGSGSITIVKITE